ncbi:response regulator [Herbaspirillum sp. RV1423]|uniref:response regulator n=1 Tax=Herbaspirillum sp. RV1423 TaxID=1443993 RepID=UPI0004AFB7D4|nr:response regulator [Herbaspirillum sp. RV1423]
MTTSLPGPAEQADNSGLYILVVEDNLDSQQLICELLVVLGHRAEGVGSGEQALVELETRCFDVLFTDVSLPGISGIELAKKISEKTPSIKIIFASGYGAQIGKNIGAGAFSLPKPYDVEQLQQILDNIGRELQGASRRRIARH